MPENSSRGTRPIWKIFLYGLLVGIVVNAPFMAVDLYHSISKANLFESIQIGMPVDRVKQILQEGEILCGINANTARECDFSDFWRHYEVALDPDRQEVRSKVYYFKERSWLVNRFGGWRWHKLVR
jgi:hypothetical protein